MKKFLSMMLSIVFVLSLFTVNAYADKAAYKININIDTDISGKTPSDYKDFITVEGEGIKLGDEGLSECLYNDKEFFLVWHKAEVFEAETAYYGDIYIYPQDGYFLPANFEDFDLTVNGEEHSPYNSSRWVVSFNTTTDNTGEASIYVRIRLRFTVEEPEPTGLARIPYLISKFFLAIATFFTETFIQPIVDLFI